MDEYLCLTLLSRPGESEANFKARLSAFWSKLLREKPDDFEKVYAEAVRFERTADRLGRRYLIESVVAGELLAALSQAGLEFEPLDTDDIYSKYEAAPPDWFWIEH
ncbi:MAG TPA: hypothetical protein VGL71_00575 [Urbifossiella sp.]